jgi:hypothetical protein
MVLKKSSSVPTGKQQKTQKRPTKKTAQTINNLDHQKIVLRIMWSTILTMIMLLIAGLTEVAASVDNLSNGRDVSEYVADQIAHNDVSSFH